MEQAAQTAVAPDPVVPGAPKVVSPPTRFVLKVLGAVGFNPYQAPAPKSPIAPQRPLLHLAWTAWQSVDRRISNVYPTLSPTTSKSDPESGVIKGNLGAYDGNGDERRRRSLNTALWRSSGTGRSPIRRTLRTRTPAVSTHLLRRCRSQHRYTST